MQKTAKQAAIGWPTLMRMSFRRGEAEPIGPVTHRALRFRPELPQLQIVVPRRTVPLLRHEVPSEMKIRFDS